MNYETTNVVAFSLGFDLLSDNHIANEETKLNKRPNSNNRLSTHIEEIDTKLQAEFNEVVTNKLKGRQIKKQKIEEDMDGKIEAQIKDFSERSAEYRIDITAKYKEAQSALRSAQTIHGNDAIVRMLSKDFEQYMAIYDSFATDIFHREELYHLMELPSGEMPYIEMTEYSVRKIKNSPIILRMICYAHQELSAQLNCIMNFFERYSTIFYGDISVYFNYGMDERIKYIPRNAKAKEHYTNESQKQMFAYTADIPQELLNQFINQETLQRMSRFIVSRDTPFEFCTMLPLLYAVLEDSYLATAPRYTNYRIEFNDIRTIIVCMAWNRKKDIVMQWIDTFEKTFLNGLKDIQYQMMQNEFNLLRDELIAYKPPKKEEKQENVYGAPRQKTMWELFGIPKPRK